MRLITVKRSPSEIGSSSVPPLLEVPLYRCGRGLRGGVEPAVRTLLEIGPECGGAGRSSGMDRCEIESHRLQNIDPDRAAGVDEFDFAGIGGNAPEDELVVRVEKRIRRTVFAICQSKEVRRLGFSAIGPGPRRWHQCLGLAQHLAAAPEGVRNETRPSKAARAGDARTKAGIFRVLRQARNQCIGNLARWVRFWIAGNLFPE